MITLKSLHLATLQAIFDQVVNHLREQGDKALNVDGNCAYLAPDGKKCAAGCFITPNEYDPYIEGTVVDQEAFWVDNRKLREVTRPSDDRIALLRELQQIHDAVPITRWEDNFEILARRRNLMYTPKEGA